MKTSEALEKIKDKCIYNNISFTLGNKDICHISGGEFTAIYEAIGHYKYVESSLEKPVSEEATDDPLKNFSNRSHF